MKAAHLLAALALCAATAATAQPLELPQPPRAVLEQRIGVRLPLDLPVLDEDGTPRRLAAFFDGHTPVLLVPGYYRCQQLCGLLMQSLFAGLRLGGAPPAQWRIVRFSIDPQDTPADARARHVADAASAMGDEPDLHLLTLAPADARRLARAVGYGFEPIAGGTAEDALFAHPASVIVVTPQGTVSRYFNGIGFESGQLRAALADAAGNRIGAITARLALLCAHFAPTTGRYTAAVMDMIRGGSLVLLVTLAAWCWRRRGGLR